MTDGERLPKSTLWEEYYIHLHRAYAAMRKAFQLSGLNQDQIAAKLGVDKSLISRRLNGLENLTLKTLSFMATAIGCRLKIEYVPYDEVQSSIDIQPYVVSERNETAVFNAVSSGTGVVVLSPIHRAA